MPARLNVVRAGFFFTCAEPDEASRKKNEEECGEAACSLDFFARPTERRSGGATFLLVLSLTKHQEKSSIPICGEAATGGNTIARHCEGEARSNLFPRARTFLFRPYGTLYRLLFCVTNIRSLRDRMPTLRPHKILLRKVWIHQFGLIKFCLEKYRSINSAS